VAKGSAGFATRQVSSRNMRPSLEGMAYRKEGTSPWVPHSPSPAAGCMPSRSLGIPINSVTFGMKVLGVSEVLLNSFESKMKRLVAGGLGKHGWFCS